MDCCVVIGQRECFQRWRQAIPAAVFTLRGIAGRDDPWIGLTFGPGNLADIGKNLGDDLAEGKMTLPLIRARTVGSTEESALLRAAITASITAGAAATLTWHTLPEGLRLPPVLEEL